MDVDLPFFSQNSYMEIGYFMKKHLENKLICVRNAISRLNLEKSISMFVVDTENKMVFPHVFHSITSFGVQTNVDFPLYLQNTRVEIGYLFFIVTTSLVCSITRHGWSLLCYSFQHQLGCQTFSHDATIH